MQCTKYTHGMVPVTQTSYPGATEHALQGESAPVCGWRSLCQGICGTVHLHSKHISHGSVNQKLFLQASIHLFLPIQKLCSWASAHVNDLSVSAMSIQHSGSGSLRTSSLG